MANVVEGQAQVGDIYYRRGVGNFVFIGGRTGAVPLDEYYRQQSSYDQQIAENRGTAVLNVSNPTDQELANQAQSLRNQNLQYSSPAHVGLESVQNQMQLQGREIALGAGQYNSQAGTQVGRQGSSFSSFYPNSYPNTAEGQRAYQSDLLTYNQALKQYNSANEAFDTNSEVYRLQLHNYNQEKANYDIAQGKFLEENARYTIIKGDLEQLKANPNYRVSLTTQNYLQQIQQKQIAEGLKVYESNPLATKALLLIKDPFGLLGKGVESFTGNPDALSKYVGLELYKEQRAYGGLNNNELLTKSAYNAFSDIPSTRLVAIAGAGVIAAPIIQGVSVLGTSLPFIGGVVQGVSAAPNLLATGFILGAGALEAKGAYDIAKSNPEFGVNPTAVGLGAFVGGSARSGAEYLAFTSGIEHSAFQYTEVQKQIETAPKVTRVEYTQVAQAEQNPLLQSEGFKQAREYVPNYLGNQNEEIAGKITKSGLTGLRTGNANQVSLPNADENTLAIFHTHAGNYPNPVLENGIDIRNLPDVTDYLSAAKSNVPNLLFTERGVTFFNLPTGSNFGGVDLTEQASKAIGQQASRTVFVPYENLGASSSVSRLLKPQSIIIEQTSLEPALKTVYRGVIYNPSESPENVRFLIGLGEKGIKGGLVLGTPSIGQLGGEKIINYIPKVVEKYSANAEGNNPEGLVPTSPAETKLNLIYGKEFGYSDEGLLQLRENIRAGSFTKASSPTSYDQVYREPSSREGSLPQDIQDIGVKSLRDISKAGKLEEFYGSKAAKSQYPEGIQLGSRVGADFDVLVRPPAIETPVEIRAFNPRTGQLTITQEVTETGFKAVYAKDIVARLNAQGYQAEVEGGVVKVNLPEGSKKLFDIHAPLETIESPLSSPSEGFILGRNLQKGKVSIEGIAQTRGLQAQLNAKLGAVSQVYAEGNIAPRADRAQKDFADIVYLGESLKIYGASAPEAYEKLIRTPQISLGGKTPIQVAISLGEAGYTPDIIQIVKAPVFPTIVQSVSSLSIPISDSYRSISGVSFPKFSSPSSPYSKPAIPSYPSFPSAPSRISIPSISVPSTPSFPSEPNYPSLFSPPSVPSVPSIPSFPSFPSAPSSPSNPSLPSAPSIPSIPSPPLFPPYPFDFGILPFGGVKLDSLFFKGTKRKFRYQPSLKSIVFDIHGKIPNLKVYSGLEERPLPLFRSFKTRRKSKKKRR